MADIVFTDRVVATPQRITLTNISGSTYDYVKVPGAVSVEGTPLNATNMNALLQRESDTKDTVTTFTEAVTRANLVSGETEAVSKGKIKKWLTDLKPHAFNDLATVQGTQTDVAPTNKLLKESTFARFYTGFAELNLIASTATPLAVASAMVAFSKFEAQLTYAQAPNLIPNTELSQSGRFVAQRVSDATIEFSYSIKEANTTKELSYIGFVRTIDASNQFSGWRRIFTTDNISTAYPISQAASSNTRVMGERLLYDQFELKAYNRKYDSFPEISGSITTSSTFTNIIGYMSTLSILYTDISLSSYTNLITGLGSIKHGTLTIYKDANSNAELTLSCKQANTTAYTFYKSHYRNSDSSNNWSGWQQVATTNYVDTQISSLSAIYDKVIKTQAEFEALIASDTWLGAVSVALVGQFTLSTANNSGIKIPDTVKQIHGFNGAKITVTNFLWTNTSVKAGLWYSTAPTTEDFSIRDLEVYCGGEGYVRAFGNCINLINCIGNSVAVSYGSLHAYAYAFYKCKNIINCYGKGSGVGTNTGTGNNGYGYGFYQCDNIIRVKGRGIGQSNTDGLGFGNALFEINRASICEDGGSTTAMWAGTNTGIDPSAYKTAATVANATLNA